MSGLVYLRYFSLSLVLILSGSSSACFGAGRLVNPFTDICWKCLFPIHVMGFNTTPESKDFVDYKPKPMCECPGMPPKVGFPIAFWEPLYLVDVTRTPYELTALGGVSIAEPGVRRRGAVSHVGGSNRTAFYNVHLYRYPVLSWLGVLDEFSCLERSDFSVIYMSEFDPLWDDEKWASVLAPETLLFANPAAQAACIVDCASSSMGRPLQKLFWCAGCMGSLYPLSGHVAHHVGAVQSSYLLLHRLLAKMHKLGLMWGYEPDEYCSKSFFPKIDKRLYKTQLVFPTPQTKRECIPLGKTDIIWGSGVTYPIQGEDFAYLIWVKKQCCFDLIKPAIKGTAKAGGL